MNTTITSEISDALQAACEDLGYDDPSDGEVMYTRETLDNYRSAYKGWRECSSFDELELGGLPAIQFWGVQAFKGQQRKDFTVIDCGDCRIVFS